MECGIQEPRIGVRDLGPREGSRVWDLGHREGSRVWDLGPREGSRVWDLGPTEVTPFRPSSCVFWGSKEVVTVTQREVSTMVSTPVLTVVSETWTEVLKVS
jgi:hypothetical protein